MDLISAPELAPVAVLWIVQVQKNEDYVKSILGVLGVLFATFVLIPWITVGIIECVKGFFDENDRFDG